MPHGHDIREDGPRKNNNGRHDNGNGNGKYSIHLMVVIILMAISGTGGAAIGVLSNMTHASEKYVLRSEYNREMGEIKSLLRDIDGKVDRIYFKGYKSDGYPSED